MIKSNFDAMVESCKHSRLSFEYITPEIASAWLKLNIKNYRNINSGAQRRYVSDMRNGLWTVTTASIAFTKSKILIDGQHRLEAIVESGRGMWSYVMRDCPDELLEDPNQDKGSLRKVTTYMQKEGIKNATAAAGAIRCLYRIASGFVVDRRAGSSALTDACCLNVALAMPELFFDCVDRVCSSANVKRLYAPSVTSSFLYLASSRCLVSASRFFQALNKEQEVSAFHPASVLREYVVSNRKTITNDAFLALAFSAFELSMKGETRKILRPCSGDATKPEYRKALDEVLLLAEGVEQHAKR